jgi:inositol hexakisphosphate/diphosphoinositol-pentakisphosphate kinase
LYARAKALFDLVAPQEYGIDMADKEEIGVLTSLPLLRKIVEILVEAKETSSSTAQFFFTKSVRSLPHLLICAHSLSTESRISKLSCTFC